MLKRRFAGTSDDERELDANDPDSFMANMASEREAGDTLGDRLSALQRQFAHHVNSASPTARSAADRVAQTMPLPGIEQASDEERQAFTHRRKVLLLIGISVTGILALENLSQHPRSSPVIVKRKSWSDYLQEKCDRGSSVFYLLLVLFLFMLC